MRRPRPLRLMLVLTAALLIVIVLVVIVGEVWVRPTVEREIAKGVRDEFDLAANPDVDVEGFPLVLGALEEHLDGIDISVDDQIFEGMRVEQVDLHIAEVRFKRSELLRGGGTVFISGGDGTATVADSDLTDYLVSAGLPVDVTFDDGAVRVSGAVTVSGVTADAAVVGELVLDGDVLRFTPTTVELGSLAATVDVSTVEAIVRQQFAFTAPVPQLEGVRLIGVGVGEGVATIDARFDSLTVAY